MCTAYVGGGAATGYYASKSKNKKEGIKAPLTGIGLNTIRKMSPKEVTPKHYRDFTRNIGY